MNEHYHGAHSISPSGRVKAAGLSFAMFTDPADAYLKHPNATNATEMTVAYSAMRKSPSDAVRNRFFPRSSATSTAIKNGPALPRTSLKNDQGVGTFLTHNFARVDSTMRSRMSMDMPSNYVPHGKTQVFNFMNKRDPHIKPLRIDIERETGFAIVEEHLVRQMALLPNAALLKPQIDEVKKQFSLGDLAAAQSAYERLIEAGNRNNIKVQRDASVGREGLFFIHPSIPQQPVEIDHFTHNKMEQRGRQLVDQMEEIAHQKRDQFAYENGLFPTKKKGFPPLYFQIDYLVDKSRSIQIADIGLPDVGFFLNGIEHEDNPTVQSAQNTVSERLQDTSSAIQKKSTEHKSKTVCFITRDAVLRNDEDTLEIKEIAELKHAVEALELSTKVISDEEALQMNSDELGILMNVDPSSPAFQMLLKKRATDESVPMYPDPFLLLAQGELTDLPQVTVTRDTLDVLKGIFTCTSRASNSETSAVQSAAVESIIRRSGMPDDCTVLHMYIPNQPTPIAFYKYDLRGLEIALNYAAEVSSVKLRGIPISSDNAVLFGTDDKPIYTTFRYMFNQ